MTVYLGQNRINATPSMTATHAAVTGLTARIERVGRKLHMDNFISYPAFTY